MSRAYFHALIGHLLLSIAALLMVVQSIAIHPKSTVSSVFEITVFFSTFLIYRLAYYGLRWPFGLRNLLRRKEIPVCLFILLLMLPFLHQNEITGLLLMSGCCLAYFVELKKWKGLRSIPVVKGLWVALAWAIITVVIPLSDNFNTAAILIFTERFLFILSLCIIYNLRDAATDLISGIQTIPGAIGVSKTKKISIVLLMLCAFVIFIHHYVFPVSIALMISLVTTAIIIYLAEEDGHGLYYSFAVDASMILQSILVISAVYL